MKSNIQNIIIKISEMNNKYRSPLSNNRMKIEALWEIGDYLVNDGVNKPHSLGWDIQRDTNGLIKRPTIFRSYKIRKIWPDKDLMLIEIGDIKRISFLTDMLPLIDPNQEVRKKLKENEIKQIFRLACYGSSDNYRKTIRQLKMKYAHGRLGEPLNKSKYLYKMKTIVDHFKILKEDLINSLNHKEIVAREQYRKALDTEEMGAFSNMCISLTTKNNYRLYKKTLISQSCSRNEHFKILFDYFYLLLNKYDDTERARLRRLISSGAFAQMSDLVSSIPTEEKVEDFRNRRQLSIKL